MAVRPDLALYDRDERLVAVVEVKGRLGTSEDWAAQFHRNLLSLGMPGAPFFLLATPDRLYLWTGEASPSGKDRPSFVVDARPILGPFFQRARIKPEEVSPHVLEFVVADWLTELVHSSDPKRLAGGENGWLMESRFLPAIHHGRIDYQLAA